MLDRVDSDQNRNDTTFEFSRGLPPVCVICGAAATGKTSLMVPLPRDAFGASLNLGQIIALFFGFIFLWWRTSPGAARERWVSLPHCDEHGGSGALQSIRVRAKDRLLADIHGAGPKFHEALAAWMAAPSADFLDSLDRGPGATAEDFLGSIDESRVNTADDFLRNLRKGQAN